jgi:hypothetical protein
MNLEKIIPCFILFNVFLKQIISSCENTSSPKCSIKDKIKAIFVPA